MQSKYLKIFETLDKLWPNAKCELNFNNDFQLLLAVVLSAQTTDKSVNKALTPIFERNKNFSPNDLIAMGENEFYQNIKSIGLAPTKAKNAYKISEILISKYNSNVPKDRENLESLPGVGRKTANVVLNILENLPLIAVDTHVARVSQRIGLVKPTKDRTKIEEQLHKCVPKKYLHKAHHLLIFHGRYLCSARAPKCSECPIEKYCSKETAL